MYDQGYCPYGTKTKEEIEQRVLTVGKYLLGRGLRQSLLPAIPLLCSNSPAKHNDIPVIALSSQPLGWPASDKPKWLCSPQMPPSKTANTKVEENGMEVFPPQANCGYHRATK